MAKRYPPIEEKWSYGEIAKFTGLSKSQVRRDCQAAQRRVDKNDEQFIYDLSAVLKLITDKNSTFESEEKAYI